MQKIAGENKNTCKSERKRKESERYPSKRNGATEGILCGTEKKLDKTGPIVKQDGQPCAEFLHLR